MSRFFVDRPIVAIVISLLTVILGVVSLVGLPIAQYPSIIPPVIQISTTYTGADAVTIEQSVATPIEQQMNGVDKMLYIQSTNASDGTLEGFVDEHRKLECVQFHPEASPGPHDCRIIFDRFYERVQGWNGTEHPVRGTGGDAHATA